MKFALPLILPLVTLAFSAAAQQPKGGDNCAPPPSSLAPTLPAKILPGMGTVHLAITTSNPEAQQFFDQGVAQMHSFGSSAAAPMPYWGIDRKSVV